MSKSQTPKLQNEAMEVARLKKAISNTVLPTTFGIMAIGSRPKQSQDAHTQANANGQIHSNSKSNSSYNYSSNNNQRGLIITGKNHIIHVIGSLPK